MQNETICVMNVDINIAHSYAQRAWISNWEGKVVDIDAHHTENTRENEEEKKE